MENLKFLKDRDTGLDYLPELPDNWQLASLDDFHTNGKKHIGMMFLVQSFNQWFFPYKVHDKLTASRLLPLIEAKRIFVQSEDCKRYPYEKALEIAHSVLLLLQPHCDRIEIAGSIRRKKAMVKDIEIVCIPKPFETGIFNNGLASVVNEWKKLKGELEYGISRYTQRLLPDGIKLDLFFANPDNWGLIYAIRTGSAEFSHEVLGKKWVKLGYHSENGFLMIGEKLIRLREEEDLFKLLGLIWIEPERREV